MAARDASASSGQSAPGSSLMSGAMLRRRSDAGEGRDSGAIGLAWSWPRMTAISLSAWALPASARGISRNARISSRRSGVRCSRPGFEEAITTEQSAPQRGVSQCGARPDPRTLSRFWPDAGAREVDRTASHLARQGDVTPMDDRGRHMGLATRA